MDNIRYFIVKRYFLSNINKKSKVDPQQEQSISSLIRASAEGDEGAFHSLYELLSNPLFRFVMVRVPTREDALDVLQEIYIDLWKYLQKFSYKSDRQFYKFVYTIARRKISAYFRKHKKIVEWSDDYIQENYEIKVEDWRPMKRSIEQLKEKYREVLELRYWSDFSFVQIAQMLDTKESTVKVRHHRALKQLESLLGSYE